MDRLRKINPIAKLLRTSLFKKRVTKNKKKYTRKEKHKDVVWKW
tara:strand:+ start:259 stop:390 length:132 start_codon:yes stop_codon:yes gene_type:complete